MLDINGVGIKTPDDLIEAIKEGSSGNLQRIFTALSYRNGEDSAWDSLECVIYQLIGKEWEDRDSRPYAFCYVCKGRFTKEEWHQHCDSSSCF